jgi:trimethylguanosine synthase
MSRLSEMVVALAEKLRYRWNLLVRYQDAPFGPELQEAWNHRYELFSRFDEGIQTDAIGLYSVTPEKTAKEIADRLKGLTVVDAFCGIGGNTIAFAAVCPKVYAVDLDKQRLSKARHNAGIYNRSNIEFIAGDFLQLASTLTADAVYLDPPWGGPSFRHKPAFYLNDFSQDGRQLLELSFRHFRLVVLRVPEQFVFDELNQFGRPYEVQDNLLHGRVISKTIYFV